MGKGIVCFLICFSMAQPMVVSAAALEDIPFRSRSRKIVPNPMSEHVPALLMNKFTRDLRMKFGGMIRKGKKSWKDNLMHKQDKPKEKVIRMPRSIINGSSTSLS